MKKIWVLILFATTMGFAEIANACSCAGIPFVNEFRLGNGVIPENSRGLAWHFTRAEEARALEDLVTIKRLDKPAIDDGFVIESGFPSGKALNTEDGTLFVIRPNEWEIGAKFEVAAVFESGETEYLERTTLSARGVFEVGEPLVSLPEDISIADTLVETITLDEPASSCDINLRSAIVTIGLPLSSEINFSNLYFETFVDGEPYRQMSSTCEYVEPGRSWYPMNRSDNGVELNRLVAVCDPNDETPSLGVGTHSVQIRASLPGTDISFKSSTTTVELACDGSGNGGCSSVHSSPMQPVLFFLFLLAILRFAPVSKDE